MKYIVAFLLTAAWICGMVLAKGFWLTTLAVVLPLYAWYLVAERLMQMAGIL